MAINTTKKIENVFTGLIGFPFAILDYIGNIVTCNNAFEELFPEKSPVSGKHIRDIDSDDLWRLFLKCKTTGRQTAERIILNKKNYEALLKQDESGQLISLCLHDITMFLRIEEDLVRRNRELMIINTLSETFISSMDTEEFFPDLLSKVLMITEFELGMIGLTNNGPIKMVAQSGFSPRFIKAIQEGALDKLIQERFSFDKYPMMVIDDADIHKYSLFAEEDIVFATIRQLMSSARVYGYLILASRRSIAFDFDVASLVNLIGNHVSLIVEKFRLYQEAKRLSITDPLTGLYNVRYFYMALKKELQRAKRYHEAFSVVIFDIDNFKFINDTFGHQAGDFVLQEFGKFILNKSRKADIVARYGGEEFVLILPKTNKAEALSVAERICDAIASHEFRFLNSSTGTRPTTIRITISGGIASYPEDGDTEKALLHAADMAMYRAKADGKGRVYLYDRAKDAKGIQKA